MSAQAAKNVWRLWAQAEDARGAAMTAAVEAKSKADVRLVADQVKMAAESWDKAAKAVDEMMTEPPQ